MRTVSVTYYKYDELPTEQAKEKARDWGRRVCAEGPAWNSESLHSIETFCEAFGIKLKRWSVGAWAPVDYSLDMDNGNFRGRKLKEFNAEHMPTGYCLDCTLWGTFYEEFKRTGSAKKAADEAVHKAFVEWRDDLEHQQSDEYVEDFLEANEYEFDEEGEGV
jgi:hypothetical protein